MKKDGKKTINQLEDETKNCSLDNQSLNEKNEIKEKKEVEEINKDCENIDDIGQIVDEDIFRKKLKRSKELVNKDKSPQKKLWSFIFFVLNVVIVAIILLGMLEGDNYTPLDQIPFSYWWIFASIMAFVVMVLIDQVRFWLLIKKSTKMKRPFLAYKVGAVGKYYDAITPLSTGGQPFQAYYLTSRGIKASHAVSIPIAKYIAQQLVFSVLSIIILILAFTEYKHLLPDGFGTDWVLLACWIGFICNFVLVALVILLSIGTFGKKFVLGILKFLNKIKLIKNYDATYEKLLNIVEEYQRTVKFFVKSPFLLIATILFSVAYLVIQYSIPYFIYCAFCGTPSTEVWVQMLIVSLMIDLAASFIPLPGGSGVAELSFTAMFAGLFLGASFWALLFWRLLTYYGYVIQGFLLLVYDAAWGNKKNKKHLAYLKEHDEYYKNVNEINDVLLNDEKENSNLDALVEQTEEISIHEQTEELLQDEKGNEDKEQNSKNIDANN